MQDHTTTTTTGHRLVSLLADELRGSEIIKLAGEIKGRIEAGARIYNYTIGDFDPAIFPIPAPLCAFIAKAYEQGHTNYPPSNGIGRLREVLSTYILQRQGLDYKADDFLVAGGGRPLIYAAYQAILDPGEEALFPVPSWNNNHYATLVRAGQIAVETLPGQNFMPSAGQLEPHLHNAGLLALCSPLNPTGTVFSKAQLSEICEMVILENKRRVGVRKPLYVLYDQIYWQLCFGDTLHYDPVSLFPEMRPYTIYIDGISKAFAATGVRVGWAFGPKPVMDKMKSILGHAGAWAPKPEQEATASFMTDGMAVDAYLQGITHDLEQRLRLFYEGFKALEAKGLPVHAIAPQAAMYLTVKIDLTGGTIPGRATIHQVEDGTRYLLEDAGLALVPFTAFGAEGHSPWYRLSVGTARLEEIPEVMNKIETSIQKLIF